MAATARWLLDQEATPADSVTEDGEVLSVLQCAVLGGNAELVQQLVAAGADRGHRCAAAEPPGRAGRRGHGRWTRVRAGTPAGRLPQIW